MLIVIICIAFHVLYSKIKTMGKFIHRDGDEYINDTCASALPLLLLAEKQNGSGDHYTLLKKGPLCSLLNPYDVSSLFYGSGETPI